MNARKPGGLTRLSGQKFERRVDKINSGKVQGTDAFESLQKM